MAWLNLTMPNQTVKNDLKAKKINCPKWIFSRKTTNKIFMYLLAPFILQNFKKILRANPELWGCAIFGPKMAHLSWTKFFWYKPLLLLSSTYWPFSLCKILKNSYSRSRVMRMHNFWAQNGPFPQMRIFSENLLMSLVSFIHAYLHTKNQSQILIY